MPTLSTWLRASTRAPSSMSSRSCPINEAKFAQKYNGAMTNAKIDETNAAILQMAQEKQVYYYLSVAEAFKDETGGLPASTHRWASFWDRELYQMVRLSENTYSNGGITAMKKTVDHHHGGLLAAALLLYRLRQGRKDRY